ncbi:MAG: extracellular solute-binding protein [Acetobacteraceae bacterium]|jgi:iron(III) transport system substrate-binding protein
MSSVVTRRRTVIGFSALSAAIVLPSRARADQAVLEAAARQEGTLTWYVAQQDTETAELFGRTFTALHPGVTVDVIRTTGQVAFQRLSLDIKNHTPHCDVFSATDIAHMPLLKEHSDLAQFTPDNSADMRPQFKAQSDAGWYYITNAGRWVLLRNSEKVSRDAAPKAWTDLLDPKWKGRVSVAHPAFSGGAGVWALAMQKLYGWDYFRTLAANDPRIGRSTQDTVTLLSGGECLVGPTWAPGAYRGLDRGNPIAITQPNDGAVVMVFPSAIPAHAPHPNAARLFMEWLLSREYSKLIATDGSEPIHMDVPARPDEPPLDGQKVVTLTVEEIRNGVPEVIEQWRDIFGG